MTNEMKKNREIYNYFRKEVYKKLVIAKMTVDYYGVFAKSARTKITFFNFLGLAASSLAIYVIFVNEPWAAAFLALIASISSIINIVSGWNAEESRFLDAQNRARFCEEEWESLWRNMDSEYKVDLDEISNKMKELGKQYADFEQRIQPHNQDKKIATEIQERIERSMKERVRENE